MDVRTVYNFKNHTLTIYRDEDAVSPRNDDNLGQFICFHKRYTIGDKHSYKSPEDIDVNSFAFLIPVYMYEHSGISLSISNKSYPFNCPWDAGQVGVIGVTKEKMKEEYGSITEETTEQAMRVLKGEVETYNNFLSGEVYGFVLEKNGSDESEDSCWGFYGDSLGDNGMLCHLPEEIVTQFNSGEYKKN